MKDLKHLLGKLNRNISVKLRGILSKEVRTIKSSEIYSRGQFSLGKSNCFANLISVRFRK